MVMIRGWWRREGQRRLDVLIQWAITMSSCLTLPVCVLCLLHVRPVEHNMGWIWARKERKRSWKQCLHTSVPYVWLAVARYLNGATKNIFCKVSVGATEEWCRTCVWSQGHKYEQLCSLCFCLLSTTSSLCLVTMDRSLWSCGPRRRVSAMNGWRPSNRRGTHIGYLCSRKHDIKGHANLNVIAHWM